MRTTFSLALPFVLACSSPRGNQPPPAPPPEEASPPFATPPPAADADVGTVAPPDAAPVAVPPGPVKGGLHYFSDCSLTHPIAHDPCQGKPAETRGLASCVSHGVTVGQACGADAPSCYIDRACPDGRKVVSDYLVCADKRPSRCLTRSSRRYKADITYLSKQDRQELARQIEALPLARFRYLDSAKGSRRLGFITEDALTSEFVSDGGRTVDLYSLLAASIAAIQAQDERIRALEAQLQQCH